MPRALTAPALLPLGRRPNAVEARIADSVSATQNLLRGPVPALAAELADLIVEALGDGRKLLLFGNGGSAADASHLAAEFVGRFRYDRPALPALSLTDNASSTSAIGNDFGFEQIFARQITAFGQPGDVAVGLTTSGRSANVVLGLAAARAHGLRTAALCGASTPELSSTVDLCLCMPARDTARVQECHMLVGHIVCELVERALFPTAP